MDGRPKRNYSGRAGITQHAIAKYLHVSDNRIYKLVKQGKSDNPFRHTSGRPPKVDDEGFKSVQDAVILRKTQNSPMEESEEFDAIIDAVAETDIRRGGSGLNVAFHNRTKCA